MRSWLALAVIVSCLEAGLSSGAPIQPYPLQWQRTYGGTSNDMGYCIALAPDGGYLLAGDSASGVGLDKQTTNYGWNDGWVIRIDAQGSKLWERSFGGTGGDYICDVKLTIDGGWIFVAGSSSGPSGNKTSPTFGGGHYWVVRIDDSGNKLWEKSFGGGHMWDEPYSILSLPDGGFLVGGGSQSNTNEVKTVPQFSTELHGDIWILRLDQKGEILWQRAYGGNHGDWFGGFDVCGTNGFIIAGMTQSPAGTGNKQSPSYGSYDFWILLVDQEGNKIWERSYGGDNEDKAFNIRCTSDGGFVVCGWTGSGISGNKSTPLAGNGGYDTWVIRLDPNGEKIWEQTVGTQFTDALVGLQQTLDGGFVMAGSVFAGNGWGPLVRLDQNGNKVWEQIYQNPGGITLLDIQNTPDGGIIAAGRVGTPATSDALVMKFGPDALTAPQLQLLPDTQRLILSGITGRTYVTEASDDFVGWMPFATNTLSSNSVPVIDPAAPAAKRFYRALMRP